MVRPFAAFAFVPLAVIAFAACGGGGDPEPAASAPASTATNAAPAATVATKFTLAGLEALAATDVPGYTRVRQVAAATNATITYESGTVASGARITATVSISPCDPFICPNLDAANFKGREAELKKVLPSAHIDNPSLVFVTGNVDLAAGYAGFFTYARSFLKEPSTTLTANRYQVQYHDGVNQLSILLGVKFEGPFPQSEAEMQRQMDQSTAEAAARAIFAPFAAAFRKNR